MGEHNKTLEKQCSCCGKIKPKKDFYVDYRKANVYLPYCKSCVSEKYKEVVSVTKSNMAGLWSVLMWLDIPMLKEPAEMMRKIYLEKSSPSRKPDVFNLYYNTLRDLEIFYKGNYESDLQLGDFIAIRSEKDNDDETNGENEEDSQSSNEKDLPSEEELKAKAERAEREQKYSELARIWGRFMNGDEYDYEAYDFLEDAFDMYTQDVLEMDTSLTMRYRDLAKAELMKRRADEHGDVAEIAKAQENLKKILTMLKLDDFQSKERTEMEKHIERICWEIENTKPAECEELEIYRDFSGFGATWEHLMRAMRNLVAGTKEYPQLPKEQE